MAERNKKAYLNPEGLGIMILTFREPLNFAIVQVNLYEVLENKVY